MFIARKIEAELRLCISHSHFSLNQFQVVSAVS